jgi:Uma2 family endonuclease
MSVSHRREPAAIRARTKKTALLVPRRSGLRVSDRVFSRLCRDNRDLRLQDIPAIIVEFVSSKRRDWIRDYDEKRIEYLNAGARDYWIIDRFRRLMTIHRQNSGLPTTLVIKESESYQTDLLPGFVLPLARLLAKADQWVKKPHRRQPSIEGGA